MKQLTVRGFDEELMVEIQKLANREGVSLNQAVLRLLRRGAGLEDKGAGNRIGTSLDALIGTWSPEETAQVERAIEDFEAIDESMWE